MSEKISNLNTLPKARSLQLPSGNYGPYCLKILQDFIQHHQLQQISLVQWLGFLLMKPYRGYLILCFTQWGREKREECLKRLDDYKMGLPAHLPSVVNPKSLFMNLRCFMCFFFFCFCSGEGSEKSILIAGNCLLEPLYLESFICTLQEHH